MTAAIIVLTLGLGIGLSLIVVGVLHIIRGIKSKSWSTVEGIISFSDLVYIEPDTADDIGNYSSRIFYEYTVRGASYTSNRVELSPNIFFFRRSAERLVLKYTDRTPVKVYYNPEKPSQSVLQTGFTHGYLLAIFTILLIGIGSVVASSLLFYVMRIYI